MIGLENGARFLGQSQPRQWKIKAITGFLENHFETVQFTVRSSSFKSFLSFVAWFCSLVSVYSELLFSIVFQGIASVSLYFL